jgi:hypothetical protein
MRYLLLLGVCLACIPGASASQIARYSDYVRDVGWRSKTNTQDTVYIHLYVKAPGAYPYKKGMTVTDLVIAAGGFVKDERYKRMPELYIYPQSISVLRPSPKDPDPMYSVFKFKLDWSKADGGISECRFELQPGDFVSVSLSSCVP